MGLCRDGLAFTRVAAEQIQPNLSSMCDVTNLERLGETSRPENLMKFTARIAGATFFGLCLIPLVMAQEPGPGGGAAQPQAGRPAAKAQSRPSGQRVKVDPALVSVEDGDTVVIRWLKRLEG